MQLTDYHAKYFAYELTKRCSSDSLEKLAGAVASAQVVEVKLRNFRSYEQATTITVDLLTVLIGNRVINQTYNAAMLAEALCKLEGFTYAPSDSVYWQQGHSTERDFIYVTTANLSHEQLQQLSDEVRAERSLLVLCTAFRGRDEYPNLTVKKIPKQVLSRCEWGHDDYSLQVENLPKAPLKPGQQALFGDGTDT